MIELNQVEPAVHAGVAILPHVETVHLNAVPGAPGDAVVVNVVVAAGADSDARDVDKALAQVSHGVVGDLQLGLGLGLEG